MENGCTHGVGTIQTFTGKLIQPLDLKPDDIDIRDIAHALSRVCRFGGHCHGVLNVAAHSVRVLKAVRAAWPHGSKRLHLTALLHDASEAYLGDIPRPLKKHPAFAFYREAEEAAEKVIAAKFDLFYPLPLGIKQEDDAELAIELQHTRYAALNEDPADSRREFLAWFEVLAN